jgi:hypothetical protein
MAGATCVDRTGAGAMKLRPYMADAQRVSVRGPYGCGRNGLHPHKADAQ